MKSPVTIVRAIFPLLLLTLSAAFVAHAQDEYASMKKWEWKVNLMDPDGVNCCRKHMPLPARCLAIIRTIQKQAPGPKASTDSPTLNGICRTTGALHHGGAAEAST